MENIQNTKDDLPANIHIENFRNTEFPHGVREKLIEMVLAVVEMAEKRLGRSCEWGLRLFHPESPEDLKFSKDLIKRNMKLTSEDYKALEENGLRLGFGSSQEQSDAAWDFLLNRKMGKDLDPRVNGYAVLLLGGQQLTIKLDSYSTKYEGNIDLSGAVDYLLKSGK